MGKIQKLILIFIAVSVPAFFFVITGQQNIYTALEQEVGFLEDQQKESFEKNKLTIIEIEYLGSPQRIEQIGEDVLNLQKGTGQPSIQIQLSSTPREEGGN